jgi:hypothetical protein
MLSFKSRVARSISAAALLLLAAAPAAYAQPVPGNQGNQPNPGNQGQAGQSQFNNSQGNGFNNANVTGSECINGNHTGNPHCAAPEVPIAALYPIVGVVALAGAQLLRSRRKGQSAA